MKPPPWHADRPARNRNPGDLRPRIKPPPWPGQSGVEVSSSNGRFAIFQSAADGWAALALWCLDARYIRDLKTATQMINVFAPPADHNPTSAYSAFVASRVGDDELDLTNPAVLNRLCRAIARWEDNRVVWAEPDIRAGMKLAAERWPEYRATRLLNQTPAPPVDVADALNQAELDRIQKGKLA